jgi:AcrR family transcriptional regulator
LAQVKKDEIRIAILRSAETLFRQRGYGGATLRAIAKGADVSLANIYAYFSSKMDILFELYVPWFKTWLEGLEQRALAIPDPQKRLRLIVRALWREMPTEVNGMHINLLQAVSSALPDDYDSSLLRWAEVRLADLLKTCLPPDRNLTAKNLRDIAQILIMTGDGFTLISRIDEESACTDGKIEAICRLITPDAAPRVVKLPHRPLSAQGQRRSIRE